MNEYSLEFPRRNFQGDRTHDYRKRFNCSFKICNQDSEIKEVTRFKKYTGLLWVALDLITIDLRSAVKETSFLYNLERKRRKGLQDESHLKRDGTEG